MEPANPGRVQGREPVDVPGVLHIATVQDLPLDVEHKEGHTVAGGLRENIFSAPVGTSRTQRELILRAFMAETPETGETKVVDGVERPVRAPTPEQLATRRAIQLEMGACAARIAALLNRNDNQQT